MAKNSEPKGGMLLLGLSTSTHEVFPGLAVGLGMKLE